MHFSLRPAVSSECNLPETILDRLTGRRPKRSAFSFQLASILGPHSVRGSKYAVRAAPVMESCSLQCPASPEHVRRSAYAVRSAQGIRAFRSLLLRRFAIFFHLSRAPVRVPRVHSLNVYCIVIIWCALRCRLPVFQFAATNVECSMNIPQRQQGISFSVSINILFPRFSSSLL